MLKGNLQKAIELAVNGDLYALKHDTFWFDNETKTYKPRPGCLTASYSSSEAVLASILLCFYFEVHGRPTDVIVPDKGYDRSVTDLIWSGAWFFVSARRTLSEKTAWDAITLLMSPSGK